MLANVWKQEDPRGSLEKASKYELWQLAKKLGFADITYEMPQPLQAKMLRERGITEIDIPERVLGDSRPTVYNTDKVEASKSVPQVPSETRSMTAEELLELEFRQQKAVKVEMTMTEMRKECKRLGIKMVRTDNLHTLREKLRGENAA